LEEKGKERSDGDHCPDEVCRCKINKGDAKEFFTIIGMGSHESKISRRKEKGGDIRRGRRTQPYLGGRLTWDILGFVKGKMVCHKGNGEKITQTTDSHTRGGREKRLKKNKKR